MKRLFALLFALCSLQAIASQPESWFLHYADGRAVIKRDSLYGFVDRNGIEVIPCQFQKAYSFNDGIATVCLNHDTFAIDTLGNRLAVQVEMPRFRQRSFEQFVYWVGQRIPFVSSEEYERLKYTDVYAVITISAAGKITACEKAGDTPQEAFEKVRRVVMDSPEWSPGTVDGKAVEIRYLLPVEFRKLRPMRCYPVDVPHEQLGKKLVYPLFQGQYAYAFNDWFHKHQYIKNKADYQRATSGVVRAAFTIDTKGRLTDIKILDYNDPVCRDQTIEALKKSPRWTPATLDGVPVAGRYQWSFYYRFR